MNELKTRGVEDILIAVVDGLKGFPEAIDAVFPQTAVQTCIVHLIRHSLDFASWKDRKTVAAELRKIYRAADAGRRRGARGLRGRPVGRKISGDRPELAAATGRGHPVLRFPLRACAIVYTTNAIEALNPSCAGPSEPEGISPPTMRPKCSFSWS